MQFIYNWYNVIFTNMFTFNTWYVYSPTPQYRPSVALRMSWGVQNSTMGLVRDWTPVPEGTVELEPGPGLPAAATWRGTCRSCWSACSRRRACCSRCPGPGHSRRQTRSWSPSPGRPYSGLKIRRCYNLKISDRGWYITSCSCDCQYASQCQCQCQGQLEPKYVSNRGHMAGVPAVCTDCSYGRIYDLDLNATKQLTLGLRLQIGNNDMITIF